MGKTVAQFELQLRERRVAAFNQGRGLGCPEALSASGSGRVRETAGARSREDQRNCVRTIDRRSVHKSREPAFGRVGVSGLTADVVPDGVVPAEAAIVGVVAAEAAIAGVVAAGVIATPVVAVGVTGALVTRVVVAGGIVTAGVVAGGVGTRAIAAAGAVSARVRGLIGAGTVGGSVGTG
jgi:hypothetical protein